MGNITNWVTSSGNFVGISAEGKALLKVGLIDDGWPLDWTTLGSLRDPTKKVRAQIIAKAPGIWAASSLVTATESLAREIAIDAGLHSPTFFTTKSLVKDGATVKPGQHICEWNGAASLILALERPFLNLASFVCGIATATDELVTLVKKACPKRTPRVTATRKTLPHYRNIAIYGLQAGGGFAHRTGLSSGVLIKENHIAAAGSIAKAIEGARAIAPHGLKIEVEVTSLEEMEQALVGRAEVIMLDNFSTEDLKKALTALERRFGLPTDKDNQKYVGRPLLEISGGLNSANIARYALPGVDVLSVGSLTHSLRALDLSLLVDLKD